MPKSLSLGTLVKYMTSDPAAANKAVYGAKYPATDEPRAQRQYYQETRDRVPIHHRSPKPPTWLPGEAVAIRQRAAQVPSRPSKTRLLHNARAIDAYAAHFSGRPFQMLDKVKLRLTIGDVIVRVTPDLVVCEKGKEKLVRLHLREPEPTAAEIQIVSQVLFEAAVQANWPNGLPMTASRVLFLDLQRGTEHRGARMGSRMRSNIVAACRQISLYWDSI